MDLSKMTAEQVHELLRLLAEMEQEEMELLVRECMKAKRVERLHSYKDQGHAQGGVSVTALQRETPPRWQNQQWVGKGGGAR